MKQNFLLTLVILLLAGCVSSGFGNPWGSGYDRPADHAPKPLSNEQATYQEAGLEYVAKEPAKTQQQAQQPQYNRQEPTQRPVQQVPTNTVQVAFLAPLSGEHADLGQALLQTAQMALFDLGNNSFSLLPRDTKGTPEGARQAAISAIDSGAQLIIGPLFSSSVRVVKPIANRQNINILAFSTDWSLAGGNTFIMGFLPFAQVQRVTEYALSKGIENIAVLAPNTDYGNAVIASYHSLAYRLGHKTADVVRFPADENDISGIVRVFTKYDERVEALNEQIRAVKMVLEQNPQDETAKAQLKEFEKMDTWGDVPFDAVLLPVGGEQARSIANLLSYYDLGPEQVMRLGTGLWDDAGLASEQSMNGALYAAPSPELRKNFELRYKELYGQTPPRLATLAYDATALASVLARNGYNKHGRVSFNETAIKNPNGFAGLDGVFRFRPDGLIERGLAIMEIKNRHVIEVDPAPRTFQAPQR